MIQLAMRSGLVKTINTGVYREGEVRLNKISGKLIEGEQTSTAKIYVAYIELKDGFTKAMMMTGEKVRAYAQKYSASFRNKNDIWKNHFDEMAEKTVLKRLLTKFAPTSIDLESSMLATAIKADQVGKLNGRLVQYRQTSAGIESYIWRTMGDKRVRPAHRARAGVVYKWSNPPEGGHTGQAVRCRCVAQPLIDESSFKLVPQKNSYTTAEKNVILPTENFGGVENLMNFTGGLAGALNPNSERAEEHAKRYYESVRKMKTDCSRIATNTGFREKDIRRIKNHVFYEEHELYDGEIARFEPSYYMAQSWQRLVEGKNIKERDIILLNHEFLESVLVSSGYSVLMAHRRTEEIYNYSESIREEE